MTLPQHRPHTLHRVVGDHRDTTYRKLGHDLQETALSGLVCYLSVPDGSVG